MNQKQFIDVISKHHGVSVSKMAAFLGKAQQSLERSLRNETITYREFSKIYEFATGKPLSSKIEGDFVDFLKEFSDFTLSEVIKTHEENFGPFEIQIEKRVVKLKQSKF